MSDKFDEMARKCASQIVYEMLYNAREPMYPAEDRVTLRIAALVRRADEQARAEERDACAKMCDAAERLALRDRSSEGARTALDCAAAIRARGSKEKSDAT